MNSYFERGRTAMLARDLTAAVMWFAKAVEAEPRNAQALASLGQGKCWQGRRLEGLEHLRQAGRLLVRKARKRRDLTHLLMLIEQLQFWEDYVGAADLARQALRIEPGNTRALQLLALGCLRMNLKEEALQAARRAVRGAPGEPVLELLLASAEVSAGKRSAALKRLEGLSKSRMSDEERFRLHKELARVLDRLERYDEVFPHLHRAAELSRKLPQVRKEDRTFVPGVIESHRKELGAGVIARFSSMDLSGEIPAPVFVVGFMRSGTTLTQQVLASHPRVFVADEVDLITVVRQRIDPDPLRVPARLADMAREEVLALRNLYWERWRGRYGELPAGKLLVDKTTMNCIDLGVINCLFPDAKVVFLVRDPRDVLLSCYLQIMRPAPSTVPLFTWKEAAGYYRLVMEWWRTLRERLTMPWMELRYEEAVTAFEETYRGLFTFLGLEWHEGVTGFHRRAQGRYVASPSFEQVARPLYDSSVGRWRHYEEEYTPVLDTLSPLIARYGWPLPDG